MGFSIHEGGLYKSFNKSIRNRVNKGWAKVAAIQNFLKSPAITQFGWLRAAITLTQATIPPVLTYAAETWLDAPKYTMKNLESAYKQMIYAIFGFGEKTKFSSVLLELGLMRIKHIIAKLQISYMSTVVWDMVDTTVHQVIMEEFKILGDRSPLAIADKLAVGYGFKKISEHPINKRVLKRAVKMANDAEVWRDCFMSTIIPTRPYFRVRDKSHFSWEKSKVKVLLAYKTGSLKFKTAWRIYNTKRGIGTHCLFNLCPNLDNLYHVQQCLFYEVKWKREYLDSEEQLAEYLLQLNRERIKKFRMPII